MIFVLVYFRTLKRKPVICKSDNACRFSRFLVPSQQRNQRKSFYCRRKYFAKENFRASAWTSAKCYCGNKTGNPERAVSLHLARSGGQSQRRIWFILPARGACHIINVLIIKITISSIVIGFPLIHLPSCYWTVCYRTACYRTVCYRTVQQTNHIQSRSLNQPITFKVVV